MSITEKHQALLDSLEALVDEHNLTDVLAALAEVCDLKADHLASNWQDTVTAKAWSNAGTRIDECAHNPRIVGVS